MLDLRTGALQRGAKSTRALCGHVRWVVHKWRDRVLSRREAGDFVHEGVGQMHPVAPGRLGCVQRAVGANQQIVESAVFCRGLRHADADGDRQLFRLQNPRRRVLAQPLGGGLRRGQFGLRQKHQKLLAAHARHMIARPRAFAQQRGQAGQHPVAHGVAVFVVDALEMIDVDHQHAKRQVFVAVRRPFALQQLLRGPPVEQPGERVFQRQIVQSAYQPGHQHTAVDQAEKRGDEQQRESEQFVEQAILAVVQRLAVASEHGKGAPQQRGRNEQGGAMQQQGDGAAEFLRHAGVHAPDAAGRDPGDEQADDGNAPLFHRHGRARQPDAQNRQTDDQRVLPQPARTVEKQFAGPSRRRGRDDEQHIRQLIAQHLRHIAAQSQQQDGQRAQPAERGPVVGALARQPRQPGHRQPGRGEHDLLHSHCQQQPLDDGEGVGHEGR